VLNDLNQNIEQAANIELPEAINDLVVLSQSKVLMKINLDEYIQKKLQIPVEVSNVPPWMFIKTFPANIEVTVNAPYNYFDSLNVSLFKATADFNSSEKTGGKLKIKVTSKNPDIKIGKYTPEKVEYILRKK